MLLLIKLIATELLNFAQQTILLDLKYSLKKNQEYKVLLRSNQQKFDRPDTIIQNELEIQHTFSNIPTPCDSYTKEAE